LDIYQAIFLLFVSKEAPKKKTKTPEQDAKDVGDKDDKIPDLNASALEVVLATLYKDNTYCSKDEQPNERDLNNVDNVATDITTSDNLTVDVIVQEVDLDACLPLLPCTIRAKSAIAIPKVCYSCYSTL
jgi:hypothetical protein